MNRHSNQSEPVHSDVSPGAGSSPSPEVSSSAGVPESGGSAAQLSPAERKAREEQEAEALLLARQKKRRRQRRAFGMLLIRFAVLLVVIYVLFFRLIGLMAMPDNDMYPRLDLGDLVIYYRLDKEPQAQDIIVFEKELSSLPDYNTPRESEEPRPSDVAPDESTPAPGSDAGQAAVSGAPDAPDGSVLPSPSPASTQPVPQTADVPPSRTVEDTSFRGQLNRLVYRVSVALGLRRPQGRRLFVSRVIAVQGDTVEITQEGQLLVNGNAVIETNIFYPTTLYVGFTEYPITLGPGECFVLADQRNGGADSRFFGPVKEEEIQGTVFTIMRRNNL